MFRRPLLPLLALAALLALPPACHGLSCYQCDDEPDSGLPACSLLDEDDSKFKTECLQPSIRSCSKVIKSSGVVIRGCYGEADTEVCSEREFGTMKVTECFCTSDYCNSAGLAAPALLLLLPAALLAALYTA